MSKPYRLYKRADDGRELAAGLPGWKDRPYYFRVVIHGVRYARCLETADAEEAQKYARSRAKEIRDILVRGDRLDSTRLRNAVAATLAQLLDAYEKSPVDAGKGARRQNVLALQQLLRTAGLDAAAITAGTLPVTHIDGTISREWFAKASARALEADQLKQASIKRTANSRFVQAKSLFVPKALATYQQLGIAHAGFHEFVKNGETFKFSKLPATSFNPPADTIIAATLAAWESIPCNTEADRNLFLAVGLELAFGLRMAEWAQARWSWFSSREGYPVLDGDIRHGAGPVQVKNGSGLVQVRALDPWYSIMMTRITAKGWRERDDDYIIAGTKTDRHDGAARTVTAWLRALGWKTRKTNHEIRKYAGSQVAMRYGIYDAQCWLRHSTVKVTEQHYSGYVRKFKPADITTLTAKWATQTPSAPILRILEAS